MNDDENTNDEEDSGEETFYYYEKGYEKTGDPARYIGFHIEKQGEKMDITMLPEDETYCEPIYPDDCLLPKLTLGEEDNS